MCATVCPSQALFFGTREQIEQLRPLSMPANRFRFGEQVITTRVWTMVPRALATPPPWVDVTAAMADEPPARAVMLRMAPGAPPAGDPPALDAADPFAGVTV
jgi:hypothetical protein